MAKKVIIIGAGLSGLTSGIYCRDNGYDVEIYEKNPSPGGECTGWYREGMYIDGCAHWIVGTNPKSDLFPLWKHVGAFDEHTHIYPAEYLTVFQTPHGDFSFDADFPRLEKEMLRRYPEDIKPIRKMFRTIRHYQTVRIPVKKPLEQMNPFSLLAFALPMIPMALSMQKYKHVSLNRYTERFHNPDLANILTRFLEGNYNSHSLFYVLQAFASGDAGVVEGGSLKMMLRIVDRYRSLGGKLYLHSPVKKIVTSGKRATGILLEDGRTIPADYVISAVDMHHAIYDLLGDQYQDEYYHLRFKNQLDYPYISGFVLSYKVYGDVSAFPKMYDVLTEPISVFGDTINHYAIRNFSFDLSLKGQDGSTLLTILLPARDNVYTQLKQLSQTDYLTKKKALGEIFRQEIAKAYAIPLDTIRCLDVTTPLTYEHYCNAYHGSYMAFLSTDKSKGLMSNGRLKGLNNVILSGQWVMPPGGLPVALFVGKHAAAKVCRLDHRKFLDLTDYHSKKKRS